MNFFRINFSRHVYSTFFPLHLISTLFGISPLSSRSRDGKRQMFCSKFSVVRSIIFAVFYATVFCCFLYTFKPLQNVLCRIRFYQDVFSGLLYICEVSVACVCAKKMVAIYKNVEKTDEMLRGLKISVTYKRTYLKIVICIAVGLLGVGTILLLLMITQSFLICYSCQVHNILMEMFTYYLPFIANFLMELQYFHVLNILRFRYKELNKCLLKNTDLMPPKVGFELVSTILKVNSKSTTRTEEDDPPYTINKVAKIHMILTDTARLVNKVYSFQQLFKIGISFVSIITALFLFAMVFAVKEPSKMHIDVLFFIWTISNALEMIIIVWVSAETCKEANECPIILHRIRNCTASEKLKALIDLHSLQMYHSKLSFSVCGLFPLDYSLLYSMIAGATTYLVILIQFNMDMVKAYDSETIH